MTTLLISTLERPALRYRSVRYLTGAAIIFFFTFSNVLSHTQAGQTLIRSGVMIPARDGVRLNTAIFAPKNAGQLPFLLLRTPYGIDDWPASAFDGYLKELADEGYIFVFQDIRGRFKSEGQFVMSRPPRDSRDPR